MRYYHKLHKKYIRGALLHFTMSDEDVSDSLTTQIAERDIYYTYLLKDHRGLTKARGICKELHKWIFFWSLIAASGFGIYFVYQIFQSIFASDDAAIIIDSIPIIITAFVSLISTIIVIPVTIAKFLFNTKEDDNITVLIQHTQDHDTSGMELFKNKLLPKSGAPKMTPLNSDEQ